MLKTCENCKFFDKQNKKCVKTNKETALLLTCKRFVIKEMRNGVIE